MEHFFIAGTDARVGKTYVICALLRDLRRRGVEGVGFCPVACGERSEARAMRDASDSSLSLDILNPFYLRTVAAPMMAAALERKPINPEVLLRSFLTLQAQCGPVLVEGGAGWADPLAAGYTMADLAQEMQLPVILVVRNQRGAAALATLTAADIRARGLELRGIILNHPDEEWDTAAVTNASLLAELTGAPVLAELIHGEEAVDASEVLGI